jgi:endoglucanase
MKTESIESLLSEIVSLPSPGTNEDAVQRLVRRELGGLCDSVTTDVHGDVWGVLNPEAPARVMICAHADEIGLVVSHIEKRGFVRVNLMGGSRPDALVGQRVTVHAARGPVPGVIGRKDGPSPKEEITTKDLYIDIGAPSGAAAAKLVAPGDTVTCSCGFQRLAGEAVTARGLDDRCGVAAMIEALRLIRRDRRKPKVSVCALSSVQEEGGKFRGATVSAFNVMPQAALVLDVCLARDYPKTDPQLAGECEIGQGPTISLSLTANRVVNRMIREAAKARKIGLQYAVEPVTTGTDGDAIASVGPGIATGVISIPCRYVHSPSEVISLRDLSSVAELVAEFVLRLPGRPDFTPF